MKRFFFLIISTAVFFIACNNNKPKDTVTLSSEDGKEKVTIDMKEMQNAAEDMEKQKAALEQLTPLSLDQLKALVPETLMGAERKDHSANAAMGASLASGKYEINDSMEVKLSIYDCAGSGGAGIYSLQFLGMMNVQEDNEEEYTKSIDFNGGKAFEHCDKSSNECSFTWFSGGRFLVTLEGDHVSMDALKQAAKGLSIK